MAFIIRCDYPVPDERQPTYVYVPEGAERLSPTDFSDSIEHVSTNRARRFTDRQLADQTAKLMKAHRGRFTFTVIEL